MSNIVRTPFYALAAAALITGCSETPKQMSFSTNIKPIIDNYCTECHANEQGEGAQKSGLLLSSYESLMKGTKYGPVIVAGDATSSTLYRLISGQADPSIAMPHNKKYLTPDEIHTVELWIDQGAKNN